jgi:hypothetical protein
MPVFESPELVGLFRTYTASPDSVAAHFNAASAGASADYPLIVASGTDIALYPGHGQAPIVEGIRTVTRGFKELAGVSHLGPAIASVMHMAELDPDGHWRADAARLITACQVARQANSTGLWRDQLAVAAYRGREEQIARLVDYSCRVTERYLKSALDDPEYLVPETLRSDYLEGPSGLPLPVPFNRIMIATFFLAGMDIAHRIISWFDSLALPWEQAMVMMVGQTGKPTGAVTRETHSIAGIIDVASRGRLPESSLLIAPHVAVFPSADGTNLAEIAGFERHYRDLWSGLTAVAELGPKMFAGYPEFRPRPYGGLAIEPGLKSVSEMPKITSADDWFALTTRMRVVLEDPRQLLSSAVTDYASQQLIIYDNDPTAVTVPGLDGEPYPALD